MRKWLFVPVIALLVAPAFADGKFHVDKVEGKPAESDFGKDVFEQITGPGYRVVNDDDGSTLAELWLTKKWDTVPGFSPTNNVLYPFQPGSLIGAIKYPKKVMDFRGQDVPAGAYTLRFALQPETGTHVGTFDTRDFLVVLSAKTDQSLAPITNEEQLANASSQGIASSHPGVMALLKTSPDSVKMNHYDDKDWWSLLLTGEDGDGKKIPLEVIVVGKASE
jgi:hypothetical protein